MGVCKERRFGGDIMQSLMPAEFKTIRVLQSFGMKRCLWSSRASSSEPWKGSKQAADVVICQDRGFLKLGG